MDETLEHLFEMLEMNCEDALNAYQPYKAWPEIEKHIKDIKDYIENTSKCSNSNHHTAGYDCCN